MLQSIRSVTQSKAGAFLVRVLFVVLIAAFGFFGIGDFIRSRPHEDTVIEVGNRKFEPAEVQNMVRTELDTLRKRGRPITLQQARQIGLIDRVIQTAIGEALLDQFARDQHIVIGPAELRAAIEAEPAFKDADGKFDLALARSVLAQQGLDERSFAGLLAKDMPRQFVAAPVTQGLPVPDVLADLVYGIRNEKRVAETVAFPVAAIKDAGQPDEPTLKAYYDAHHAQFTAPEYRGFTVLAFGTGDVGAVPEPTEDQIKDAYDQSQDRLTVPEQRHVLQITVPDQKTADAAVAELGQGKDFLDVAKRLAHQDKAATDLDWLGRKGLPAKSADAIFDAKDGETTKPIETAFGWSVYRIAGVRPTAIMPLDEARPELVKSLKSDEAGDLLFKLRNAIEDALAGGATIDTIAEQFKLKPVTVAAADDKGLGPDSKKPTDLPVAPDTVLKTAFATPAGETSPVQEVTGGTAFFVVRTNTVTPPALKPLDAVKEQVVAAWQAENRAKLAHDRADTLEKSLDASHTLAARAAEQKLEFKTSGALVRNDGQSEGGLPGVVISRLFALKQGESAVVTDPSGAFVVRLKEVDPADPKADEAGIKDLKTRLAASSGQDALQQFEGRLKETYKVTIDQAAIDRLFPEDAN